MTLQEVENRLIRLIISAPTQHERNLLFGVLSWAKTDHGWCHDPDKRARLQEFLKENEVAAV